MECPSALKGPFEVQRPCDRSCAVLFAVRCRLGWGLNGPFQGRIVGDHRTQGFALGCKNEPFRLEDCLTNATRIANSATSKSASKGLRFPCSRHAWSFVWVPLACAAGWHDVPDANVANRNAVAARFFPLRQRREGFLHRPFPFPFPFRVFRGEFKCLSHPDGRDNVLRFVGSPCWRFLKLRFPTRCGFAYWLPSRFPARGRV